MYTDVTVRTYARIVHRDAVSVELDAEIDGEFYNAVGVARRHPEDSFDAEIGLKLAYSRALENISNQLARQANGAVKHAEDMRTAKQIQKQSGRKTFDELYQEAKARNVRGRSTMTRSQLAQVLGEQ